MGAPWHLAGLPIAVLGWRQGLPSSPLLGGMLKHSNVLHLASAPTQHVQRSICSC